MGTRRRARWTTATVMACAMMVMATVTVGGARAQTCEAGCAPEREARDAARRSATLARERDAIKSDYDGLTKDLERVRREAKEAVRAATARATAAESERDRAKADGERRRSDAETMEKRLEQTMKELDKVRSSESRRVKMLEEQVQLAEEAWVPIWLQRRAEPVTKRAKEAVEIGKKTTAQAVKLGQEKTAQAVEFGKENIPKVVQAVEKQTKKVVEVSKEQTAKVVNAANERIPHVVNAGKEQTAKLVNAGKGVVGGVSKTVGQIPKKVKVLKELKQDFKEAKAIHEKKLKTGKPQKKYPQKFSTRQAVRALELTTEAKSLWRVVTAKISAAGFLRGIFTLVKDEFNRIFNAVKKSYRERFIPFTQTVRAFTAKHVGIKLATLILGLPTDVLQKIPFNLSSYGVEKLSVKIADGIWTVIVSIFVIAILRDIFIIPENSYAATYSFMKVPEENGVDVLIRLPRVESMDEVDFQFDQTFNQITIDAEQAGHSELIVVPKCKIGVKRWAKPSPIFLEGEEVVLVELRPVGSGRDRSSIADTQPPRAPSALFQPFAPVTKRAAPKKKASADKVTTARTSRSRR